MFMHVNKLYVHQFPPKLLLYPKEPTEFSGACQRETRTAVIFPVPSCYTRKKIHIIR